MDYTSVLIEGSDCQKVVLIPNQICSVASGGSALPVGNEGDIYQIVGGTVQAVPMPGSQFVVNPDGSATHTSADGTVTTLPAPPAGGNSTLVTQADGTVVLSADDGNTYTLDPNCNCVTFDPATGEVTVTPTDGSAPYTFNPSGGGSTLVTQADSTVILSTDDGNTYTLDPNCACVTIDAATGDVVVTPTDGSPAVTFSPVETVTSLAPGANPGELIFTDESGTPNTIVVPPVASPLTVLAPGANPGELSYTDELGAVNTVVVPPVTSPLTVLAAGANPLELAYTDELGAVNTVVVPEQTVFTTVDANGKVADFQGDINVTGVIDPVKTLYSDQGGPTSFDPVANAEFQVEFQGYDLNHLSATTDNILHLEHDTGHVEIGSNVDTGAQLYVLADDTSNLLKLQRDGQSTLDINNVADGRVSITATNSAGAFQDLTLQPDEGHVSIGTPSPNGVAALTVEANSVNNYKRAIKSTVIGDGRNFGSNATVFAADFTGAGSANFLNGSNTTVNHQGGTLNSLFANATNLTMDGSVISGPAAGVRSNVIAQPATSIDFLSSGIFRLDDKGSTVLSDTRTLLVELIDAGITAPANTYNLYATGSPNADQAKNYLKHWTGINTLNPTDNLSVNGTASKSGGGSWAVFSDERIKTNVSDYGNALEKIEALRIVEFEYSEEYLKHLEAMSNPEPIDIDQVEAEDIETAEDADDATLDAEERNARKERREAKAKRRKERRERRIEQKKAQDEYKSTFRGKKQVSVIAQEAQKVFPNAVEVKSDLYKDQLSFDSNEMIYANVAATKELATLVRSQAAVIEELSAKVEALETGRASKA